MKKFRTITYDRTKLRNVHMCLELNMKYQLIVLKNVKVKVRVDILRLVKQLLHIVLRKCQKGYNIVSSETKSHNPFSKEKMCRILFQKRIISIHL